MCPMPGPLLRILHSRNPAPYYTVEYNSNLQISTGTAVKMLTQIAASDSMAK